MINATRKGLAAAVVTLAGLGAASQASADVYGAGYLEIDGLTVEISNLVTGAPGLWQFQTAATADLNGASSPGTIRSCNGNGPGVQGNCDNGAGAGTVLSGPAQNAPGSAVVRGEDDFSLFGQAGQYSNAESSIIDAALVGDPSTSTGQIAESNLVDGTIASASTNVQSTTALNLTFEIGESGGGINISFDAIWAAIADNTGSSNGLAQGNVTATATINGNNGTTFVRWSPNGTGGPLAICVGADSCTAVEAGNLNAATTSAVNGFRDEVSGSGFFSLAVTGLQSGTYSLALVASTSSLVSQEVPAPATLLLLGAGLLAGAGLSRRKAA